MILFLAIIILCLCITLPLLYHHSKSGQKDDVQPVDLNKEVAASAAETDKNMQKNVENEGSEKQEKQILHEDEARTEKKVTQNEQLVINLHKVLEEDKVFLRPDIHIDDVAKMLLTNRTYVTQLMRQEYGLSFIEYINVARIQHSQSLLYSSNMTLDEVALQSGFQSTTNYCRAFKRYIGTSPMNWLQQVKE